MKSEIESLTENFLRWPLPNSVCADLCATKQGPGRIGTNLLSFAEAKQMFTELVAPLLAEVERLSGLLNVSRHLYTAADSEVNDLKAENAALKAQVERLEKDISLREDADNIADTEAYKTAQLITDLHAQLAEAQILAGLRYQELGDRDIQLATATAELTQERARLDWLETQGTKPRWTHNPESNFNSWSVVGKPKHETVRRAIDAHIDAARAQEDRK